MEPQQIRVSTGMPLANWDEEDSWEDITPDHPLVDHYGGILTIYCHALGMIQLREKPTEV